MAWATASSRHNRLPRAREPDIRRQGHEPSRGAFSKRLAAAFATVAALTALLATILLSVVWNYQFDQYVRGNLQLVSNGAASLVAEAYELNGDWTIDTLSVIPRLSIMQGMAVQIVDESGQVIYDDLVSSTVEVIESEEEGGDIPPFFLKPAGRPVTSPVIAYGRQVGTVRVWAYGANAVLSEQDLQFRQGSFIAVAAAALVAIFLASFAGVWYAGLLVRPIATITAATRALRQGDREARTNLSGDDEISVLGATFDEMADAIEADRQLERRLTADVAHELRTPLQAIQATVEAMQDGVLAADVEHLGIVRNETRRLGRLADAILELTRLERGILPFSMERTDAAVPVRMAIDAAEALVESCDLTLEA
ncbi:MAG: HAMP domain-containing protein, partial [Coriobacteriia bacterium]|nr:HAMP domain-containing protein [Coriobacteriia bacterium]